MKMFSLKYMQCSALQHLSLKATLLLVTDK